MSCITDVLSVEIRKVVIVYKMHGAKYQAIMEANLLDAAKEPEVLLPQGQ